MPKILTVAEAIDRARRGTAMAPVRLASPSDPAVSVGSRVVSYILSGEAVARDDATIAASGWQLDNFQRNPVFLWAHDAEDLPIGKIANIGVRGGSLTGDVEYADADTYPFADTVFRLVKGRFLNAVSVSWLPIKWRFSADKNRPGGVDFLEQELLEVSQVPVPSDPTALATARAQGIGTGPLYEWAEKLLDGGGKVLVPRSELEQLRREAKMPRGRSRFMPRQQQRAADEADWKCGAARDLAVIDSDSWDGGEAEKAIFAWAGGDDFDPAKARQGFLLYDAANPKQRGSYKEPFASVVDGELKVSKGGIKAAASRLPQVTGVSDAAIKAAGDVLDAYKEKAGIGEENRGGNPKFSRDLYTVSCLADVIGFLAYIQSNSRWEEDYEGDDSPVPDMLAASLKDLGAVLIAMTAEEVAELLASVPVSENAPDETAAMTHAARLIARRAFDRSPTPTQRAGKVISAANESCLREACGIHEAAIAEHQRGLDMVRAMLADATADKTPADDGTGDLGEDAKRAKRIAEAKRLQQAAA